MGFQKNLNNDLPVGVEGDFASTNPYHTLLVGEGEAKAGESGVLIGRFAWFDPDTGTVSNAKTSAKALIGFARRDNTALIVQFTEESSLKIPKGFAVTLYDGGDFWARFAGGAQIGQKVYANTMDGSVNAADSLPAAVDGANFADTGFVVASNADAGALAKITKY